MAGFNKFRSTFPEDNNKKGEAFEVFLAEWMFKNHPVLSSQFRKVWRFAEWPRAWFGRDIGTDLIAEDYNGKICAVQAKFYKESSTIPKGDVDSFLSDSARAVIDYRLLIATTDRVGLNATVTIEGQEKGVQLFLLNDFLDPFHWPDSLNSLSTYKPAKPKQPRPHQREAIMDVVGNLKNRGQLLMACGTGKTLTGQRIAEKIHSRCTLVLLPSLLLLSQTVKDWVSDREQSFIFLPVCSDKSITVKADEIALSNAELCFRPTTDSREIAEFLRRSENKVIFSTYQSSAQIAEAFRKNNLKSFDLIIADEAHRLAGKAASTFSTVLAEDLIPANKRLFMTATPKIYATGVVKKAKDADVIISSMDDEDVFGPVFHRLSFGIAITRGLLTDYQVVVVGVNSEMCHEMVKKRTFVKTDSGFEDNAKSIATQLGLSKAVRDYDLKRVISFHSRVNLASDFASSFVKFQDDLKSEHKPAGKISYSHVSGKMLTSERSRRLRALGNLENEDRYLLANVRCLSEGVDVPAVDGIAFVDPRRSDIDIIQSVGRAIRLSLGKEKGTIIIPVFISDFDDPEQVLSGSEFDQIWKVINALRSHDESLGEVLDELRVGLGRKQKISLLGTKIFLDLPVRISDQFIRAFETKLVEATTASWELGYGFLIDFKESIGDCLVPGGSKVNGFNLGAWVKNQRSNKTSLTQERLDKLNEIEFVWDPLEFAWNSGFAYLSAYKEAIGDVVVPREYNVDSFSLGRWVHQQRVNKNSLTQERLDKLNEIEFVWDPLEVAWNNGFAYLSAYKQANGDCLVPDRYELDGFNLGDWVGTQRKRKTSLTQERLDKLNEIKFVWDAIEFAWNRGFVYLSAYKEANGDCRVPSRYQVDGFNLGNWVNNQRQRKNKTSLTQERLDKLNSIGFF